MTVRELIDFLRDYDGDCTVTMLQCADDNPMRDDLPIMDAVAIESAKNDTYIVFIPQ